MLGEFDVIIVGGGLVGSCLVAALQQLPLKIALIEARKPNLGQPPSNDGRAIALTYGSQLYLEQLGLWAGLAAAATPILQVHTSGQGHFGITRFSAAQYTIPALGYVVPISQLQPHLQQAAANIAELVTIAPAEVCGLIKINDYWQLTLKTPAGEQTLLSKLVIAADGANSTLRVLEKIPVQEKDYQQTAIITNVHLKRSHLNIAYERFTADGAVALLPRTDQQSTLVWTLPTSKATELLALSKQAFMQCIQTEFGYRAGRFIDISALASHPLKMSYADPAHLSEIIFIGNAAQTVHPIAAQGFNLGLRDVAVLANLITELVDAKDLAKLGSLNAAFVKIRQPDQQRIIHFTDAIIRIFANDFLPLAFARSLALTGLEIIPALKYRFVKTALGIIS